jgi:DNA polymerase III subunit delta'
MSEAESDDSAARPPRATTVLFGHAAAERTMLDAYRGENLPHAWLIGGPPGIGKATLAYRMARFVLARPDPAASEVRTAQSLALPDDHPVLRRVAAQGHTGLLVLERTVGDTGKLRTRIAVDHARKTVPFFGSTAGEGGWRIAVIDSVDELNAPSANALLKILEEPPQRAMLLLVSHAPGRVLPTIRSRCRMLTLRTLSSADVARAAAAALDRAADDPDLVAAAEAADGSVARALVLLEGPALALRRRILDLMGQLPDPDPRTLHALGDALAGTEPTTLIAFLDTVNAWLAERLARPPQDLSRNDLSRLARVAGAWEKINAAGRDAYEYNLDRKPLVFNVFGWLAEATRG